jgi:hypothetical protein
MLLAEFVGHVGAIAGVAVGVGAVLRYGSDGILRLVAGITAIAASDNRSRAERALDVLRLLRRNGGHPHTRDGSSE